MPASAGLEGSRLRKTRERETNDELREKLGTRCAVLRASERGYPAGLEGSRLRMTRTRERETKNELREELGAWYCVPVSGVTLRGSRAAGCSRQGA